MTRLAVRDVAVRFGGITALDGVTFDVATGTVTGLIGPNGAGKTTCFNVITGLNAPDAGSVLLDGVDITTAKPYRRARLGIARTFQRLETFRTLTARENVLVAAEFARRRRTTRRTAASVADEVIERVGIRDVAGDCVEQLPTGTQRLVELGRALATDPTVLLLDEPSSGLNDDETVTLGALLGRLAEEGLAVLLVEHDMSFIMQTCTDINVLDFGRVIARGDPESIQRDPAVRAAYLGDSAATEAGGPTPVIDVREPGVARVAPRAPVLELDGVRAGYGQIDVIHDVSFSIAPGEVLAILGPNGAGKSTTMKVASGQLAATAGDVRVHGSPVAKARPDALVRRGLCSIPEGRSIFPSLTVAENLLMCTHTGAGRADIESAAYERFPRLSERHGQLAGTLSGGEQQMLAMARALATSPRVLLLDELSMGLAPLIVEELYEQVARLAASDLAIVIVEQFAHDVLAVATDALVMTHGRVVMRGTPGEVVAGMDAAYLGLSS